MTKGLIKLVRCDLFGCENLIAPHKPACSTCLRLFNGILTPAQVARARGREKKNR